MASKNYVRWRVVGLIAACAAVAHAQTAPPIKPGLWEVTSERFIDGKPAPDPRAQMQNMSPEVRKQMEAYMKQRGLDVSGGASGTTNGNTRVCLSREQLDGGMWRSETRECKTDFSSRSNTLWKWRSVCTQPASESEGEAVIASSERYTVKVHTTSTGLKGQPRDTRMTLQAKWLGADCGDVKPFTPPAQPPKRPAPLPTK